MCAQPASCAAFNRLRPKARSLKLRRLLRLRSCKLPAGCAGCKLRLPRKPAGCAASSPSVRRLQRSPEPAQGAACRPSGCRLCSPRPCAQPQAAQPQSRRLHNAKPAQAVYAQPASCAASSCSLKLRSLQRQPAQPGVCAASAEGCAAQSLRPAAFAQPAMQAAQPQAAGHAAHRACARCSLQAAA